MLTVRVSLSAWEMAQVQSGAGREGMAAAAWLGEVGVRAAAAGANAGAAGQGAGNLGQRMQAVMSVLGELAELRRILRNVGGNCNDVARHANSTGTLVPETGQVLALVSRVVLRIDTTAAEAGRLLVLVRRAQLGRPLDDSGRST